MSQLFSGKDTILNINHLERTRSIASPPYKIVLGNLMRLFTKKSFYSQECSAELGGGRGWR